MIKNISEKLNSNESWIAEVTRELVEEEKSIVTKEKRPQEYLEVGFFQKNSIFQKTLIFKDISNKYHCQYVQKEKNTQRARFKYSPFYLVISW